MISSIETLSVIRSRCAENQPLTPDLCDWLAQSIDRYLQHHCDLNEAFGLVQGRGGVPWWRERAIRERDAALRALSNTHFSGTLCHGRARSIHRLSERYATTSWPRDREVAAMPERYRGTPKENLWRAFRSSAKMPVSERRLRTILGE